MGMQVMMAKLGFDFMARMHALIFNIFASIYNVLLLFDLFIFFKFYV